MPRPMSLAGWPAVRLAWGRIDGHEPHPHIAFVSFQRWALYRMVPSRLTWHVVPDLVVEIDDESHETLESQVLLNDYFKAGVNRVWIIRPHEARMLDYQSPSEVQVVERGQFIDGGSILPGFQHSLSDLLGKTT